MEEKFDELNYLMTSDFDNMDDASPEQFKELLLKFRYEYRLLSGKNTSLLSEVNKLTLNIQNLSNVINEKEFKYKTTIANLENDIHFIKAKLSKKLSFKERFSGKLNEDK